MEAEREQSWRIRITARANTFNFRLRFVAATYPLTWKLSFFRFSILLKLHKSVFRISSEPKQRRGSITSKFMKIIRKFRPRLPKTRPNVASDSISNLSYPKDAIHFGFWVVGFLAFLAQSISKRDQKRILMVASVGFCVASLLFKKFNIAKVTKLAALLLVAVAIVVLVYDLFSYFDYNYWDYLGRYAWNKIGKSLVYRCSL
ncbi:uncharacterized protein LOC130732274 [Lotus japonicus]|uniref:uncharacterized protein LOC130732274 n=1 Tax=Lotus japonicus TaxID=34305 RepID=UPI0025875CDC|nr:uncharacterized protein LOC130732274 [Lotus japonicus]